MGLSSVNGPEHTPREAWLRALETRANLKVKAKQRKTQRGLQGTNVLEQHVQALSQLWTPGAWREACVWAVTGTCGERR